MEKKQAIRMLGEIEGKAQKASMTGAFEDAGGYMKRVLLQIAAEARQRQWIDEGMYTAILTSEPDNNIKSLDEIGVAAAFLKGTIEIE